MPMLAPVFMGQPLAQQGFAALPAARHAPPQFAAELARAVAPPSLAASPSFAAPLSLAHQPTLAPRPREPFFSGNAANRNIVNRNTTERDTADRNILKTSRLPQRERTNPGGAQSPRSGALDNKRAPAKPAARDISSRSVKRESSARSIARDKKETEASRSADAAEAAARPDPRPHPSDKAPASLERDSQVGPAKPDEENAAGATSQQSTEVVRGEDGSNGQGSQGDGRVLETASAAGPGLSSLGVGLQASLHSEWEATNPGPAHPGNGQGFFATESSSGAPAAPSETAASLAKERNLQFVPRETLAQYSEGNISQDIEIVSQNRIVNDTHVSVENPAADSAESQAGLSSSFDDNKTELPDAGSGPGKQDPQKFPQAFALAGMAEDGGASLLEEVAASGSTTGAGIDGASNGGPLNDGTVRHGSVNEGLVNEAFSETAEPDSDQDASEPDADPRLAARSTSADRARQNERHKTSAGRAGSASPAGLTPEQEAREAAPGATAGAPASATRRNSESPISATHGSDGPLRGSDRDPAATAKALSFVEAGQPGVPSDKAATELTPGSQPALPDELDRVALRLSLAHSQTRLASSKGDNHEVNQPPIGISSTFTAKDPTGESVPKESSSAGLAQNLQRLSLQSLPRVLASGEPTGGAPERQSADGAAPRGPSGPGAQNVTQTTPGTQNVPSATLGGPSRGDAALGMSRAGESAQEAADRFVRSATFANGLAGQRINVLMQDDQLGRISLRMVDRAGLIQAVVRTEGGRAAQVITDSLPALMESLAQRGLASFSSSFQGQPQDQQDEPRQGQPRRQRQGASPGQGGRRGHRDSEAAFRVDVR